MSITSRINFLQLARYSRCYGEQACRNQFEKWVDFARINTEYIRQNGSGHYLACFDPTYLRKAGKATPGTGKYWSSVAQQVGWGLELGLLAVVDIYHHTAFHVDAVLTPSACERRDKELDLIDHYAQCIIYSKDLLTSLLCQYLVVDAYFAKREFIDRIIQQTNLSVITRLRKDANCHYLYKGPKRVGKGAPKKYAGKVDWHNPDYTQFTLVYQDTHCRTYQAQVYCVFLKRTAKEVYYLEPEHTDKLWLLSYSDQTLQATLWWFKLMCVTGLDYPDARRYVANRQEFERMGIGGRKIVIRRNKPPHNECDIPMLPELFALLEQNPGIDLEPQTINDHVKVIGRDIAFDPTKPITIKTARKTAGAYFLYQGYTIAAVSRILGHDSIQTTERYYVKVLGSLVDKEMRDKRDKGDDQSPGDQLAA